jgi:hypothetical protein
LARPQQTGRDSTRAVKLLGIGGHQVPDNITLRPIPRKVASQLPKLRPYQFARLPIEILIVNPTDRKVADIVNRHA